MGSVADDGPCCRSSFFRGLLTAIVIDQPLSENSEGAARGTCRSVGGFRPPELLAGGRFSAMAGSALFSTWTQWPKCPTTHRSLLSQFPLPCHEPKAISSN